MQLSAPGWSAVDALYAALTTAAAELPFLGDRDRAFVLRDAVCAAVDELRAAGRTSERVVFLIKWLAAEAGLDATQHIEAIEQIAGWCVQRYYAC
jgi:hypothetical protein